MIELLPEDKKEQKLPFKKMLSWGLVILLLGGAFYLYFRAGRLKEQNMDLATRLDNLSSHNEQLVNQIKQRQELRKQENTSDYFRLTADLGLIVPSKAGLEKFKLEEERLTFKGKAADSKEVTAFSQRLRSYPYFEEIGLVYSKERENGAKIDQSDKKQIEFKIEGSFINGER